MTCPFSIHLATYRGPVDELKEHLRACKTCQVAAGVIAATTQGSDQTPDCPEESLLAAYDEGLLEDRSDYGDVIAHIRDCACCLRRLIDLKREETTLEEAHAHLQAGNAYLLAKQLAEWLATEAFPREEVAVKTGFEVSYQALVDQAEAQESGSSKKTPELIGLGFMGKPGLSLAQKIIALSSLAGQIRCASANSPPAVADALEKRRSALQHAGLGGRLLDELIHKLRSPEH